AAASVITLLLAERFEVHLSLASAGHVIVLDHVDHALDRLAAVQPSDQVPAHHVVEALDDFARHGGGLVVAVIGALGTRDAESVATRAPHGLALVIDRGGFGADGGDSAEVTVQRLALGGWRSLVVRPGDQLPRLWEQLTLARAVRR